MSKVLITTRVITQQECPWLDNDVPAGTVLWSYDGATYGVVSDNGKAVSAKLAETPFFEVPVDAIKETCG